MSDIKQPPAQDSSSTIWFWGIIVTIAALVIVPMLTNSKSSSSAPASGGYQPQPAAEPVGGYKRSNGTEVAPYVRSQADGNFGNNFSTKGNVNPHTQQPGTKTKP